MATGAVVVSNKRKSTEQENSEAETEGGFPVAFLDAQLLSSSKQENLLMRPFAAHIISDVPEGVLNKFILWRITSQPLEARRFMIIDGGQKGLVRHMRDGLFPIEPEVTFAKWRRFLAMNIPVFDYWSFIACYVNDEGVERMVRQSWSWEGPIGEQIYACIKEYVHEQYSSLMKCPMDRQNGLTMLAAAYAIMWKHIACFDRRGIILGGSLKPVSVPLSRNECRERVRDKRESEAVRLEAEAAKRVREQAAAAVALRAERQRHCLPNNTQTDEASDDQHQEEEEGEADEGAAIESDGGEDVGGYD